MSAQLRPGYKQTEIGVIPEDWIPRSLSEVVTFLDGRRRPVKDTDRAKMRGEIPYYGASGIVDYVNDYLFDEDLILLGEDGENILSRNCRLAFRISGKTWVNNHAHVLKPNSDVSIGFLTDYLESLNYERFNSGTAQPKLNKQTCAGIMVALPATKAEQEAIANALSDADGLIESLEQLLDKKRHLKQGAMQELLTGKKRLPGFSGEWERVRAGSIGTFRGGSGFPTKFQGLAVGEYPFFKVSDMNNEGNEKFMEAANNFISESSRKQLGATAFPRESIVFAKVGAAVFLERKKILLRPSCLDNNMAAFVLDAKRAHFRFVHFVLMNTSFGDLVSTTALPSLNGSVLAAIELPLPPLPEQIAIADILTDMDAEISDLEAQLAKTRTLKQGMMHKLLTGEIRLI